MPAGKIKMHRYDETAKKLLAVMFTADALKN